MAFSLKFDSLGKKFLVPTILICFLVVSALGLVLLLNNRKNIESNIDKKADAVATFITNFSANYFAIYDFNDFDNMAKAMKADPDVAFFTILNAQREPMTSEMAQPSDTSKLIVVERAIKDESGSVLGYVKIGYNKIAIEKATRQNATIVFAGVLGASALMGLCIALLTQLLIVRRVNFYVDRLKDIAMGEGDLTKKLDTAGSDELVELAKWFNTFVGNIREIVSTVQSSVSSVSTSSHELATTAESLTSGAKDQSMQTELVASAMTEMSQTIIEVAKNASDAATASQDAADNAGTGRQVVERAVEAMLRIAETVREATETIGQLGMSSSEIGNIIKVIDEIADQTNLLALNAAIEAARAGEHGRGFAVVADEVRKLAERTGKATKEIATMIEKIQQDTDKSVVSMDAGTAEVETGVALAKEAMSSLEVIVNSSNHGKDMVHRIAVASEEQSTAAEDVSQKMEEILHITQGSAASTTQIKQTSEQLEKLSIDLQKMIGIFKV